MGLRAMYSKDMLIGILLSATTTDVHISRNETSIIGYTVKVRLKIRGSADYLLGIQRSLGQHQIKSYYRSKEHRTRPRPILTISGIKNSYKVCELVPPLPDAKDSWSRFRKMVDLLSNKEHLTLSGLERLMEMKGVL